MKRLISCLLTFIGLCGCEGRYYYFETGSVFTMSLRQGESKSITYQIGRVNCDEPINFHLENDLKPPNLSFSFQPNPVTGNSVTLTVSATQQASLGKFVVLLEGTNSCSAGRYRAAFGFEILAP